jgi:hypothetical protein
VEESVDETVEDGMDEEGLKEVVQEEMIEESC